MQHHSGFNMDTCPILMIRILHKLNLEKQNGKD